MPDSPTHQKSSSLRFRRKRDAIMQGAAEQFLKHGYLSSSVDNIAAAAGVSKQTVYKHFGDKETLFTEFVVDITKRSGKPYHDAVADLRSAGNSAEALRALARTLIGTVLEPTVLRLRRLIISEVERFPKLGQYYFDEGPGRGIEALAELFLEYREKGLLHFDDARNAAAHFTWLVISSPLNMVMLLGEHGRPSSEEIELVIDDAIRIFLAAHGTKTLLRGYASGR